jgi:drug/metabolite transporter (DMT)-like permease
MDKKQKLLVPLCLLALYFIWGSTFLGMKLAIESFPPFLMAALRFLLAGTLLYLLLRMRGVPSPRPREWGGAAIVGTLLLGMGNGGVAYAQQWVATSVAAMVIGTVPMWAVAFAGLWGHKPKTRELLGLGLGTLGVIVLNLNGSLQASPLGGAILLSAAMAWAFGSMWARHLSMPEGAMASAAQMLCAGVVLVITSLASGERMTGMPSTRAVLALAYLALFGSFIAYSAYLYLLKTVRPALATSYAFVNPVVATLLGVWLLNEQMGRHDLLALGFIIASVLMVLPLNRRSP